MHFILSSCTERVCNGRNCLSSAVWEVVDCTGLRAQEKPLSWRPVSRNWEHIRSNKNKCKSSLKLSTEKTKIMASGPITSRQIDGEIMETVADLIFLGSKNALWKKSYDKPRQHIKKQRHYFAHKGLYSQSYGFSSGHVWMWELDHKGGWAPKNWYFWTVVLEKTLESPLDSKEIKSVSIKGNHPWLFIGSERVTSRKARGLQTEEIGCTCQTFLSPLSCRRKQTSNIFFLSLCKFKRFLLKYCVALTPGFTWS